MRVLHTRSHHGRHKPSRTLTRTRLMKSVRHLQEISVVVPGMDGSLKQWSLRNVVKVLVSDLGIRESSVTGGLGQSPLRPDGIAKLRVHTNSRPTFRRQHAHRQDASFAAPARTNRVDKHCTRLGNFWGASHHHCGRRARKAKLRAHLISRCSQQMSFATLANPRSGCRRRRRDMRRAKMRLK